MFPLVQDGLAGRVGQEVLRSKLDSDFGSPSGAVRFWGRLDGSPHELSDGVTNISTRLIEC